MNTHLAYMIAQARSAELRRAAQHRRSIDDGRAAPAAQHSAHDERVTLRFGSPADDGKLARLSALDSAEPPVPPVLLAEVNGQLRAALGLSDGTAVADPFHRTAELMDLLRARARQLNGTGRTRRSGRLPPWSRLRALAGDSRSPVETD